MYQNGRTGLLRPPDLQLAINWRDREKPGLKWAQRYDPAFERTMVYLRTSEKEYLGEEERKTRIQSRKIKNSRAAAMILGGAAILAGALMFFAIIQRIAADEAADLAREKQREEELQRQTADSISKAALFQKKIADSNTLLAMQREKEAMAQREIAVVTANIERLKSERVEAVADSATRVSIEARQNEELAIASKNEALRLRMISIGRSMSVKSLNIKGEKDLQTLLAYQAYIFNKKNGGIENDADIYNGLYNVARQYGNVNCRTFRHDGIKSIAFVPGKNEFYTAGSDFQVRKWSLEGNNQTFQVIYTGTEIIEVLAVSPDASWLACGSEKNAIRMIPLRDNSLQYSLNGHTDKVKSLIFSYDGKYLYSASLDGKVLKWDIAARTSKDITSGSGKINSIDISSDGNYIAGLNPEGNVMLWDPESVTDNFRLPTGLKDIRAIRFKPDESTLAIGDVNGNVELWDINAKEKISEIKAHSAQVNAIEFNPVLKQMATAGMDNTLKIFNNLSDLTEPPVTFTESGNFVLVVRFSPDGQLILSGAFEGEGNLVSRPSHADLLARDLYSQISRNMTQEEWNIYVGRDLPLEKTYEDKDYSIKVKVVK
jgi:WD40 repeat protein